MLVCCLGASFRRPTLSAANVHRWGLLQPKPYPLPNALARRKSDLIRPCHFRLLPCPCTASAALITEIARHFTCVMPCCWTDWPHLYCTVLLAVAETVPIVLPITLLGLGRVGAGCMDNGRNGFQRLPCIDAPGFRAAADAAAFEACAGLSADRRVR